MNTLLLLLSLLSLLPSLSSSSSSSSIIHHHYITEGIDTADSAPLNPLPHIFDSLGSENRKEGIRIPLQISCGTEVLYGRAIPLHDRFPRWIKPTKKLAKNCKSHTSCISHAVVSRQPGKCKQVIHSITPKLFSFDPLIWYLARRLSNGSILSILLLLLLLLLLLNVIRASLLSSSSPHILSFLFLGCILSLGRGIHRSLGDRKRESCLHKLKTWCNIINISHRQRWLDDAIQKVPKAVSLSFFLGGRATVAIHVDHNLHDPARTWLMLRIMSSSCVVKTSYVPSTRS